VKKKIQLYQVHVVSHELMVTTNQQLGHVVPTTGSINIHDIDQR
jgi:hypothetical protein